MSSEEQILDRIRRIFSADGLKCRTTQELCSALPREDISWIVRNKSSVSRFMDSVAETLLSLCILEKQIAGQEVFRMRDVPPNDTETRIYNLVAQTTSKQPKSADEIRAHMDNDTTAIDYLERNFYGRVDLFVSFYPGTFGIKSGDGAPPIVCLRRRAKTPSIDTIKSPPTMLDTDLYVSDVVRQVITALSGKGEIFFSTMGACMKDVRKPLSARGYDSLQNFFCRFSEIFNVTNEDTTNVSVSLVYATADNTFAYLKESGVYPILTGGVKTLDAPKTDEHTTKIDVSSIVVDSTPPEHTPTIPTRLMVSGEESLAAVEKLSQYSHLAVDCEGLNRGADICLIQISARSKNLADEIVYIFDVRKRDPKMLQSLKKLLEHPGTTKVLHDSRLDVAGMRLLGIEIVNVIDTQVAQSLYLQLSRIACVDHQTSGGRISNESSPQSDIQSLSAVLRQHCGLVETDHKDLVRLRMNLDPDLWRKEIDEVMIQYAAFDVTHLLDAANIISEKCHSLISSIIKRASGMYGQGTLRTTDLGALMNPIIPI